MQVFGLPRQVTRSATAVSCPEATESGEAAHRREILARWQQARDDGLTADQAARAVPRSTLYRWQKSPARAGPDGCGNPTGLRSWLRPCRRPAPTSPCGARPGSPSSCTGGDTRSAKAPHSREAHGAGRRHPGANPATQGPTAHPTPCQTPAKGAQTHGSG